MSVLFPSNPGTSLGAAISNLSEDMSQSPQWINDIFPNNSFIDSETHAKIRGFCRDVLFYEVPLIGIRYWDVAILVPNVLVVLFLLCKSHHVLKKIRSSKSPVFKAFFFLVYLTTSMNVTRCVVSMSISITNPVGEIVDKSITEGFFDLHSEGGLVFWMFTSAAFTFVYILALFLPLTCVKKYITLPSKCSFYLYCILLSFLNILQALGATLLFFKTTDGMCLIDFSTYLYFCLYTPVVYVTFLRHTLKKQKDESGTGELPESYYPRFSGLTSPSYDDLFDCERDVRFADCDIGNYDYPHYPYDVPLMTSSAKTAESTVTTGTGSEDLGEAKIRHSILSEGSLEKGHRQLKGLGVNGTLVFDDDPYPMWER
uniref:G_PROTEIN_RECEP_F1_2 domain-containing protein n=1 Tax=Heterorhabditis bacteriophora TaxID=37862 RepID=A0A1I7XJW2_HETBA